MPFSTSIGPIEKTAKVIADIISPCRCRLALFQIGIVIQWCVTDKRHPFISLIYSHNDGQPSSFIAAVQSLERLCLFRSTASCCNSLDPSIMDRLPLAVRCVAATFYSKSLQIQQNHDNQVDHIRVSLKEACHSHLFMMNNVSCLPVFVRLSSGGQKHPQ